jgi:serine O-acetyltransferase
MTEMVVEPLSPIPVNSPPPPVGRADLVGASDGPPPPPVSANPGQGGRASDSAIAAAFTALHPAAKNGKGDADWQADLLRYPRRPFFKEQSAWALWVYRFGRRNDRRPAGFFKRVRDRVYWLMFRVTETLTGISIPKSVDVGPGLRIWHFGNIFVHKDAKLGANCTLRQGVTIGSRTDFGPVPVLEDDVDVGAYAQILGGIRIGRGAKIGAMSVVLCDVPTGGTAVGIPARVIERKPEKVPVPATGDGTARVG